MHHPPSNPTDLKILKSTVVCNSPPMRFARVALGGYETGGRRGAPPKRPNLPPVCSRNATSWKSRDSSSFDDCDAVRRPGLLVVGYPQDPSDVIFRWATSPTDKFSPVLPPGGSRGVRTGGPMGGTDTPDFRIFGFSRSDVSRHSSVTGTNSKLG